MTGRAPARREYLLPDPPLRIRETDRMLTVTEIAEVLRVSKMTVYRLLDAGELRGYRVGRSVRVRVGDLRAYVQRHATGPGSDR